MKAPKPELRHIVALIEGYLKREGISMLELSRRLGMGDSSTHPWVRGRCAPSRAFRGKLAALLKVDEAELLPRDTEGAVVLRRMLSPAEAQARALEAHLKAPLPAQVLPPRQRMPDVLSYAVASDGQAELRVVARGPNARMAAVFRMLLDAGLVPGGEEEDVP